jgi:hypothetical protein
MIIANAIFLTLGCISANPIHHDGLTKTHLRKCVKAFLSQSSLAPHKNDDDPL